MCVDIPVCTLYRCVEYLERVCVDIPVCTLYRCVEYIERVCVDIPVCTGVLSTLRECV